MVRRILLSVATLTLLCVLSLPAPSFAHGGGGGGHGGGGGGHGGGGFGGGRGGFGGGYGRGGFGYGGFGYGYGFGLGYGYGLYGYPGYGYGYYPYDYGYPYYGLNGASAPSYYGYANAAPVYRSYYATTARLVHQHRRKRNVAVQGLLCVNNSERGTGRQRRQRHIEVQRLLRGNCPRDELADADHRYGA
jgi:hypothetical protein